MAGRRGCGRIPRFTFMATLGGFIAEGRSHRESSPASAWMSQRSCRPSARRTCIPTSGPVSSGCARSAFGKEIHRQPARPGHRDQPGRRRRPGYGRDVGCLADGKAVGRLLRPDRCRLRVFACRDAYVGDRVDNDIEPAAATGLRPSSSAEVRGHRYGLPGRESYHRDQHHQRLEGTAVLLRLKLNGLSSTHPTRESREEGRTMSVTYQPVPIPHVAARRKQGPPKVSDEHVGTNGRWP